MNAVIGGIAAQEVLKVQRSAREAFSSLAV